MTGKIEFMWKDSNSMKDNCPALHRAPGGYFVQGRPATAKERAQLQHLNDDEVALFVPTNLFDRLKTES